MLDILGAEARILLSNHLTRILGQRGLDALGDVDVLPHERYAHDLVSAEWGVKG